MKCETQRFKNSFFPDAIGCWNKIGSEMQKIETLSLFKKTITGIVKPEKKCILSIAHTLRYLYQLRARLTALRPTNIDNNLRILLVTNVFGV